MAILPDKILQEFVDEFGDDAERALRSEITRHRITRAITAGVDPATAVADALSLDPLFLSETDRLGASTQDGGSLEDRLKRWG
jgi:hypothetical protein